MFSCGKRPFTGTSAVDMISDVVEPSKRIDGWRVELNEYGDWYLSITGQDSMIYGGALAGLLSRHHVQRTF